MLLEIKTMTAINNQQEIFQKEETSQTKMKNNISVINWVIFQKIFFSFSPQSRGYFLTPLMLGQKYKAKRICVEMTVHCFQSKVLRGTQVSIAFLNTCHLRSSWSKEDVKYMIQMTLICQVQPNLAEPQPTTDW